MEKKKGGKGKRKIEIKKIKENEKKFVTYCKRRAGLFKKVEELSVLTGCRIAALVFSPAAKKSRPCGDMSLIDQYISDTSCPEEKAESEVEEALRMHGSINVEEMHDLNELMAMRSDLERIRETLLQRLNIG